MPHSYLILVPASWLGWSGMLYVTPKIKWKPEGALGRLHVRQADANSLTPFKHDQVLR
jgi:hypothetical protein